MADLATSPESRLQHYAPSSTSNPLPPIAQLTEQIEAGHNPEASVSALRLCHCNAIKPLLRDVVDSMLRLKECLHGPPNVFAYYDHPVCNDEHPVRTVQWILERLRAARCDLDDLLSSQMPGGPYHDPGVAQSLTFPGRLKRNGHTCNGGESSHKRARLGPSNFVQNVKGDLDCWHHGQIERPYIGAPTLTDSFPATVSPAGSTLSALAAHSLHSPAMSYRGTLSVSSVPTSSVTSACVADLQHQVTLKSLALQSLQSKYASLLQQLQRERAKSQMIERKTTVTDREVNELTCKVEDLVEKLVQATTQLEDSETKRETERLEAQREKAQWSRMLEMSGRLQTKVDAEIQRLQEANEELLLRISQCEDSRMSHPRTWQNGRAMGEPASMLSPITIPADSEKDLDAASDGETAVMRQHIVVLNARIDALRTALSQVRAQSASLEEQALVWHRENGALKDMAEAALKTEAAGAG